MRITVFYSWQSDSPDRLNRSFIQAATDLAIERVASAAEVRIEPSLDRDTQDLPGSPAIAQAILEKIDRCGLFLGDVTLVTERSAKRSTPNPNVLIELGYAAARIGWERIICVMNETYGGPKKLPFDLQHRRWPIRYRLGRDSSEEERAERLGALSENIELAIRSAILSGVLANTINPKDRRVAIKFEAALSHIIGTLAGYLNLHGYEPAMSIILTDHQDEAGSRYPPQILVDPLLKILSANSLTGPSNMTVNGQAVSWGAVFANELMETATDCNRILDQYADRDDTLIAQIDDIANRAQTLASILVTCLGASELKGLYENGIPEIHMDFFRYFLLAALRSYRVIREFRSAEAPSN